MGRKDWLNDDPRWRRYLRQLMGSVAVVLIVMLLAKIGGLLVLWLAWASTPPAPPARAAECSQVWPVVSGDRLWDIARTCYPDVDRRVAVEAIKQANPGIDAGRLRPGQTLLLPGPEIVAHPGGRE